jgi:transposase-like protein
VGDQISAVFEKVFRRHKRPVGGSWRMDETYIKVKGVWKYLYRAVDKEGNGRLSLDGKALRDSDVPEKVTMDKSGANKAAIVEINASKNIPIVVRQVTYLNTIVEQDHRAITRVTKPMLSFQSFRSARNVLAGIELMHMIRKGQLMIEDGTQMSFAEQFYALAG